MLGEIDEAPDLLRDDCSRCKALCCLALAFDKSDLFGFDKSSGAPCKHLDDFARCAVHDHRSKLGFGGCVQYSCNGAGQRVIQECFHGQSWQLHPELVLPMMRAFQYTRMVHDLLLLLKETQKLPLNAEQHRQTQEFISTLTPNGNLTEAWLELLASNNIKGKVFDFLRTLDVVVI